MAEGLLTMFGKAYDTVGSADKNLVLLTRGDLKIRWGNKYIDLIKNGKINVDVDLIKKVDSKDAIFKNGIYLIEGEETNEVWLYVDGTLINLVGEIGTTYVSYVGQQDVDAEGRFRALSNIGFYYNTLQEALEAKIELGLIFNLADNKLYYIKDGQLILYEQNVSIPNPLVLGSITIDGDKSSIYSTSTLYVGVGTATNLTLKNDLVEIGTALVTHGDIESHDYIGSIKGYTITTNESDESVLEIDIVKIRKNIEYINEIRLTYSELITACKDYALVKDKKYIITDFQNEWEVTDVAETYLNDSDNHTPNVHPIVLTAISSSKLSPQGYFEGHEDWIIDYDIDYYYYIKTKEREKEDGTTEYIDIYSKGRITKLVDELGNEANYDFKHRVFKYTSASDDLNLWFFTFNINNNEYDANPKHKTWENLHIYRDATLKENTLIKNNKIYIKEPELEFYRTNDNGETEYKVKMFDLYIIFPNCTSQFPFNNEILKSSGTYEILDAFYNNKILSLLLNVTEKLKITFNFSFTDNTFENIYMIGEYVAFTIDPDTGNEIATLPNSSSKKVKFTAYKQYYENIGKDLTNVEFKNDVKTNTFLNIENVIFEGEVQENIFKEDLFEIHFYCTELKRNLFNGIIDTDSLFSSNRETYPIKGKINDNVFNKIVKTYIDGEIIKNTFNDITDSSNGTLSKIEADISNSIFQNIIGTVFKNNCVILNIIFYDEEYNKYYDISESTIEKGLVKVIFKGDVQYVDFKGTLNTVVFHQITGQMSSRVILNDIEDSTFHTTVYKLDATDSDIAACDFYGYVTDAVIRGDLINCLFRLLYNNINVGKSGGTLSNITIQVDISPSSAQWVQELDPTELKSCNPLKINATDVPRLSENAHKDCFIKNVITDDGIKVVFWVQLITDDNTPSGVILMWSGSIDNIPKGYGICDGRTINGVTLPNLSGRFIRMIDSGESTGPVDNSDLSNNGEGTRTTYIQLLNYHLPLHTHNFTISADVNIEGYTGSTTAQYTYGYDSSAGTVHGGEGSEVNLHQVASDIGSISVPLDHTHNASLYNIVVTLNDDSETYPNNKINVAPNAYALIFIMKL